MVARTPATGGGRGGGHAAAARRWAQNSDECRSKAACTEPSNTVAIDSVFFSSSPSMASSTVSFFFFLGNSEHNVDVGLLWNLATAAVVDGGDKHRWWRSRRWAQRL
ncbi:hypothetical protein MRB53_029350 [Persea americana]|uniref:Uncharacterized protein n=1 Tax=Persea americana TaxID=3435 RepID=A0ACC2KIB1_PERAE|nr:hypothetical protein MRB53_029350 [Persea americana]